MPAAEAPKKKEEYVQWLVERTSLRAEVLREMTVEKLKVIYRDIKEKKKPNPLPSNWRRFNKASLQELYEEQVAPWYKVDLKKEKEYRSWTRDRLIVELENYVFEVNESGEGATPSQAQVEDPVPTCQKCMIKMLVRHNRATGEPFYGCANFPRCRECMSLSYGGVPAGVMQRQQLVSKEAKTWKGYPSTKGVVLDTNEEMDGSGIRRAVRSTATSEASWDALSTGSEMPSPTGATLSPVALTVAEKQLVKELRKVEKSAKPSETP